MQKSRYTEEKIIKILKESEVGKKLWISAGNTGSAMPPFTNGDQSMGAWM